MKRKGLIVLATIVVSSLAAAIYVTAKQPADWEYYAYGEILDYQDAPSAEIKSGFWNLKVSGKKIWLNAYYLEENLDPEIEGSPFGSVDIFEWSMLGNPMMMYEDGDKLYIFAQLQVKKSWATFDGTYEPKNWKTWRMLIIDFSTEEVLFDSYPPDPFSDPQPGDPQEPYPPEPAVPEEPWTYDWDVEGTLVEYLYPPH